MERCYYCGRSDGNVRLVTEHFYCIDCIPKWTPKEFDSNIDDSILDDEVAFLEEMGFTDL